MARTGVHLLFQVSDVVDLIRRFRMGLRVAGAGEVEAAFRGKVCGEVAGVGKVFGPLDPFRKVAPEREDVLDVDDPEFLRDAVDVLFRVGHTGEMGDGLDAVVVFDARGDLRGAVVIALSPGAVGDADEVGLQGTKGTQLSVDGLDGQVPFRREHFEGKDCPSGVVRVPFLKKLLYFHNRPLFRDLLQVFGLFYWNGMANAIESLSF